MRKENGGDVSEKKSPKSVTVYERLLKRKLKSSSLLHEVGHVAYKTHPDRGRERGRRDSKTNGEKRREGRKSDLRAREGDSA